MKLIVGLGNYGKEYQNTRHNVGFLVLDEILGNVKWKETPYGFYYKDSNIIYLKPTTFMNLSGGAILYFVNYFKIKRDEILVIYDDIDTEIGEIKIKYRASSGGHNGIKSIIKTLNTKEFLRIKVGISKKKNIDTADYVLGKFSKKEKEIVKELIDIINNIIIDFKSDNSVEYLMNKYN